MGQFRPDNLLRVSGSLVLALALLILPLRWVLAWIMAAAIHEVCHLAAVRLCGGRVDYIRADAWGATMVAEDLSQPQELFCVLAGPIGASLVLLPLVRWLPATAVCALCQSAYNLLPFSNRDGGRALGCALRLALPSDRVDRVCQMIHRVCICGILLAGIYGSFWLKLGLMPLLLSIWLVIKGNSGKIPCNRWPQAVQ